MRLEDCLEVNNLKKTRLDKNLRQWQLSLMAQITISRISQIEQGAPARKREKELLAGALGVDVQTIWPEHLKK